MKLYEIAPEIEELHQKMTDVAYNDDLSEGEQDFLMEELNDELNQRRQEFKDKALDIACLIKNELAEAQAIGVEIDRLKKRQWAHINAGNYWKEYLQNNLPRRKYEDGRAKLSWRKSKSLYVEPMAEIPEAYQKIRIEPDKMKLKRDIQNGVFEPTVEIFIEEHESLQVK